MDRYKVQKNGACFAESGADEWEIVDTETGRHVAQFTDDVMAEKVAIYLNGDYDG